MPVSLFVEYAGTQAAAAALLGVAAPTMSLWLSRGRSIFVLPKADGQFTYYEVRVA